MGGEVKDGRATRRVIVVGAGSAGLCAAYELSALGHGVTVLEAQNVPGGRVHTLRAPFADGLYAEAGAARIPTSHDLTLGYAHLFGLPLVPFVPADSPSSRYADGQRTKIVSDAAFEGPTGVPPEQKRMTPPEVRRRYIDTLADQIGSRSLGARCRRLSAPRDRCRRSSPTVRGRRGESISPARWRSPDLRRCAESDDSVRRGQMSRLGVGPKPFGTSSTSVMGPNPRLDPCAACADARRGEIDG